MLRLLPVTDLAQRIRQSHGLILAALKGLQKNYPEPLIHRLSGPSGKRIWYVDMDVLEDIYISTPAQLRELSERVEHLEALLEP